MAAITPRTVQQTCYQSAGTRHLAKATLIERYRDYDTTGDGARRADELEPQSDELRRDARWAISDIVGRPRVTVELI
ncbi:head completion/stabilization protein [Burkholderia multivorans]|uniref:head completion/stabilization protein n=1 Tax=Burkholderia multivorans TaxID=87883 RepID=UPI00208E84A2|nr:head completion/stabilization protein [Burkholderia multivorans]MCO1344221.1 head completion/stabilization protein [Burkholderia multivorans]